MRHRQEDVRRLVQADKGQQRTDAIAVQGRQVLAQVIEVELAAQVAEGVVARDGERDAVDAGLVVVLEVLFATGGRSRGGVSSAMRSKR